MKKFLLSMLLAGTAIASFAQGKSLKFTLNGKAVSYPVSALYSYTKIDKEDPKHPYKQVNFYVGSAEGSDMTTSITFYLPENGSLKPGKYPLGDILAYQQDLPAAYISIDEKKGEEDYTFYGTNDPSNGTLEVTAVNGNWVEGKFAVQVPERYGNGAGYALKEGSFRFQVEKPSDY